MTGDYRLNRIRRWLSRSPQPHTCVGEQSDGQERKVKLTNGRYRFSDATKALMECVRIIGLDEDGNELRTLEIGKEDAAEIEEEEQARAQRSAELNQFRDLLATEVPNLIDRIAARIESASKVAFEAGAQSYRGAFDSLLGVVKAQGTVATSSMRDNMTLLRTLQAQQLATAAAAEAPEQSEQQQLDKLMMQLLAGNAGAGEANGHAPGGGLDTKMLMTLLSQFMSQQQPKPPAPPAPTNGAS